MRRAAVVAVTVVAAAGGIVLSVTGGGGSSNTANLWVDSDGGTCTRQSSAGAYSDAGACSSLQAAYTACQSGDYVNVRAGSYASQSISGSTRTGPSPCTFRETNGDVTVTGDFDANGDWTTVDGFTFTGEAGSNPGAGSVVADRVFNVSWSNVRMLNGMYLANTENTTITGSEICCKSGSSIKVLNMAGQTGGLGAATANANLTIAYNQIYDSIRLDNIDNHKECIFLMGVQTATITGNEFWNCAIYSISVGRIGTDPDPSNVLIENNTMEPSDDITVGGEGGFSTIVLDHVSTRFVNLRIRNNSMAQGIEINTVDVPDATGYDQTFIDSNIINGQGSCTIPGGGTSPTWRNNVLDGANCGTGATMVADVNALFTTATAGAGGAGFAGKTWDFNLASSSSPARGAASTTSGQFSTTDLNGCTRDGSPDAGAIEYGVSC